MYALGTHAVPNCVYEYEWRVLTGLRRWKERRRNKVGEGAITCKAYSADSSEATGSKRMEAYGRAFEGRMDIGGDIETKFNSSQSNGRHACAAVRTRKRHNHIALGFGCTLVLCSDLPKVQRQAANCNAEFQEWIKPPQTTLYTLGSRLLYWWKRMHVSRLALHVLLGTGKQGSATEGPDYQCNHRERGGR
jgi:hypothetical protein